MLERLVSGGQTGADRAALDVALERGIPCGGWCPKGRRAEDGPIPDRYPLRETPSADYPQRTEWNVRDSDGTLALSPGRPRGGTAFTLVVARELGKPHLHVDLGRAADPEVARAWISEQRIRVLNVAGPRESDSPGIHDAAAAFLRRLLDSLLERSPLTSQ
jgi:hypothetical protein